MPRSALASVWVMLFLQCSLLQLRRLDESVFGSLKVQSKFSRVLSTSSSALWLCGMPELDWLALDLVSQPDRARPVELELLGNAARRVAQPRIRRPLARSVAGASRVPAGW